MGLITYNLNIGLAGYVVSGINEKEYIKKEVDFLLTIMPRGTEFLDAVKKEYYACLSIPYVLTFGHPAFENGTTLEIERFREIWENQEGKLEEADVLGHIRYIRPDGVNRHYPYTLSGYVIGE